MKKFWPSLADLVLSNRIRFVVAILLGTAFMAYKATQIELSYELAKILPASDPDFQLYESFKKRFGEDGSVMVIGMETKQMYQLNLFSDWYELGKEVKAINGIKDVVSNANLYDIVRNDSLKRFVFKPLLATKPSSQAEVDSLKAKIEKLPAYKGLIFNETGTCHLMLVTFDQKIINSKVRIGLVNLIKAKAEAFGAKHHLTVRLSGMPYIRTEYMSIVVQEMALFLVLVFLVTVVILLIFFRSPRIVFFASGIVLLGVIWAVGTISLLGYQISVLNGLIPPLIIVIGIPNCIFLLNKYHEEYVDYGDQWQALRTTIIKIGPTISLANITTAIGFGVFAFTGSKFLVEFGIVASSNVLVTFAMSLVLIPIIFSYLPPPSTKHVQHLEAKRVNFILNFIDHIVHHRRGVIYTVVAVIVAISIYGMTKITAIGYVVDDMPVNSPIYADLKFFEKNFHGVIPFEVSVDALRPGRALSPQVLNKIRRMDKEFAKHPEFTKGLSVAEGVKFFYQAYRGGDPKYYVLPPALEMQKLSEYATGTGAGMNGSQSRFAGFLDSTRRYTRVSYQMADVGTVRTRQLIQELQPKVDSIFNFDADAGTWVPKDERYEARITGNSVAYTKGNEYLLTNLQESTLMAIVLICLIMWGLFQNPRMILIATLPSTIPLLITAGIMGYFGIPLKPSTILIFSIAFGIASDGTAYFMTRYRDNLRNKNMSIATAVSNTIQTTGISMFYTAIILFSGFFVFVASTFRGTQSLGILISITLLIAMVSNLVLLPAFLMSLDKREQKRSAKKAQ
ncbi:MAG: MMPL family transporter [Spirosomataceae bacterium]